MSSVKKRIEDAVIAILNAGGYSQSFTAVRGPRSLKKLEQTQTLQVIVAAVPQKRVRAARNRIQWDFAIGIGLFKNVGFVDGEINPVGLEDIDVLAEEIAESLDRTLTPEGLGENGPLAPEVDYEPDDGILFNRGIATAQVNAQQVFFVSRNT